MINRTEYLMLRSIAMLLFHEQLTDYLFISMSIQAI